MPRGPPQPGRPIYVLRSMGADESEGRKRRKSGLGEGDSADREEPMVSNATGLFEVSDGGRSDSGQITKE
jgi:hypothetical protein